MLKLLKYILCINPVTLYINFKYFKFKDAVKFPILVFGKVSVQALKGNISISAPLNTGMIKFGFIQVGIFPKSIRTIFDIHGTLEFVGKANFGRGAGLSVNKGGYMKIGDNFKLSGNSSIIASHGKSVTFGNDCLISWDVLVMNSDFHEIYDMESKIINPAQDVVIEDHVWIGCRSLILKGAKISKNSIIAANSTVVGNLISQNSIYAGNIAKKIKENVIWKS